MQPQYEHLYFHFPFCEARCHYCDFYALAKDRTNPEQVGQFERCLRREVELRSQEIAPTIQTIFFGGGTPSMTSPGAIRTILRPLFEVSHLADDAEWTMECNPSSITPEKLGLLRALGVNRLSFGVQSTQPELLHRLGRVHDREAAFRALEMAFILGFENISVDLMCGIPGQTLDEVRTSIEELTKYPITHLSCYLLTLPPHHPMAKDLPSEDVQLEHLLLIDAELRKRGFEHYEISNFARIGERPGQYRARHNLAYWKRKSYLGFGPSAHSYDAVHQHRWKNFSSLHRYAEFLEKDLFPVEWRESLTADQTRLEEWLLALRLEEGFPQTWITTDNQRSLIRSLMSAGKLEVHPEIRANYRLTPLGLALSDKIIAQLA